MKSLFMTMAALTIALGAVAQGQFAEPTVFHNDDVEFHQIDDRTWHANGHLMFNESIYLVAGDSAAILIDAGTDIPGLKTIAERIAGMPVTLVATHVHPDHTGATVNEWDSIWINAADEVNTPIYMPNYQGKKLYLHDGQTFDLGGRTIEVVFAPGHTPGSTIFIDRDAHYGFSGDAFGSGNLLVFTNLSTVAASAWRMARIVERYGLTHLYPGHYWGMNADTINRITDVGHFSEQLIDGTIQGTRSGDRPGLEMVLQTPTVRINYGNNAIK